jgi:hypothetical protein
VQAPQGRGAIHLNVIFWGVESMKRAWSYIQPLVGAIAAVLTIIFAWRQCADVTGPAGRFILLALLGLIVFLLLLIGQREFRYDRKSRYAEVISSLNQIFLDIQAITAKENASQDEIRMICGQVVNTLASLLSLITATRCSACIKIIEGTLETDRPKVITFCRDQLSQVRDRGPTNHWIDQNTDFEEVLKSAGTPLTCFFANYLPWLRGYKNTSFDLYGLGVDLPIPMLGDLLRSMTWKLPYRSTIVAPITPSPRLAENAEHVLAGYLCVDSRSLAGC